jgi:hypothetical protein
MTKGELMKMASDKIGGTADSALPQCWLDAAADRASEKTGIDRDNVYWSIMIGTCWHYAQGSTFGRPLAMTVSAHENLCSAEEPHEYVETGI